MKIQDEKTHPYWYIDDLGIIQFSSDILDEIDGKPNNWMIRKAFGNYFATRLDAERELKKLKAWKRLKEKGFKFEWWISEYSGNNIEFYIDSMEWDNQVNEDLDLLFGGEHETH